MMFFLEHRIAWKLAFRQIRQYPRRAALTLVSIVIGVAAVVAVTIATETTDQATHAMFQSLAGRASLEVSSIGGESMDQNIGDLFDDVPGIKAITSIIQRPTVLSFDEHRIKLFSLGITPSTYQQVHPFEITEGQSLDEANGVLIDADLANNLGAKPGDIVKLLTRRGLMGARVVGLFRSEGTMVTTGGASVLMTLPQAQYAAKIPGKISLIQIVLQPDVDEEVVRAAISRRLPSEIHIERPAARSSFTEETALSIRQAMLTSRAFLLLVATLIIANTYLINVTERRRQFGIMRSVGATKGQVTQIVGCEALLLGLIGSLVGWMVGIIGARFLTVALSRLYETPSPSFEIPSASLALAIVFGITISIIGVWLPARQAGRLAPIEAMREALPTQTQSASRWPLMTGTLLVIGSGISLAAGISGYLPTESNAWSGVMILAGLVLMMPSLVTPLSWLAESLMRPIWRVESHLARLQLLRHQTRTTLTIGVLFVSISTGVGMASSVIDNVNDVKNWYRKMMVADFFVRAMSPDMATGQAADIPDEVGTEIGKLDHLTSVETVRFVRAKANDRSVIVVAHDVGGSVSRYFESEIEKQSSSKRTHRRDEVIVGSVLATRAGGLKAGDFINLETNQGTVVLPIAAVVNDYLAGGQTIYLDRKEAERLLEISGVDAYLFHVDHQFLPNVHGELEALVKSQGLILESFSDVHDQIDRRMSGVVAGLWGLVTIGFIVATLGVTNTLLMNVMEQTREIGLLRIVGATQQQVRRIVLAQSLIIGVLALVPGVIAGAAIAYLISLTTYPVSGHPVAFVLHPLLWITALTFGFLVVILAAWFPARHASHLPLLDTLRVA